MCWSHGFEVPLLGCWHFSQDGHLVPGVSKHELPTCHVDRANTRGLHTCSILSNLNLDRWNAVCIHGMYIACPRGSVRWTARDPPPPGSRTQWYSISHANCCLQQDAQGDARWYRARPSSSIPPETQLVTACDGRQSLAAGEQRRRTSNGTRGNDGARKTTQHPAFGQLMVWVHATASKHASLSYVGHGCVVPQVQSMASSHQGHVRASFGQLSRVLEESAPP